MDLYELTNKYRNVYSGGAAGKYKILYESNNQGLINRWAKWAIAQGGKVLRAANFHSTCRNK